MIRYDQGTLFRLLSFLTGNIRNENAAVVFATTGNAEALKDLCQRCTVICAAGLQITRKRVALQRNACSLFLDASRAVFVVT